MYSIFDALKCVICRNILKSPVILPCGHSVCKNHAINNETDELISCNKCGRDHKKQDFLPNEDLANIIEIQISNSDWCPHHNIAKESCAKLETTINQIEQLLNDPHYFSYEKINKLQRQVELKREELKKQIDNEFDKVYTKLDEYKQSCKSHLETNEYKIEAEKISSEVKNARNKLKEWVEFLNEVKMSYEPKWGVIKTESEKSIGDLEITANNFKQKELLLQKFEENKFKTFLLQNINITFDYLRFDFLIIDLIRG